MVGKRYVLFLLLLIGCSKAPRPYFVYSYKNDELKLKATLSEWNEFQAKPISYSWEVDNEPRGIIKGKENYSELTFSKDDIPKEINLYVKYKGGEKGENLVTDAFFKGELLNRNWAPTKLRVVTYNIHQGEGYDGNYDLERISKYLKSLDADLIFLQELYKYEESLNYDNQVKKIVEATGYNYEFSFTQFIRNESALPTPIGLYGNLVLSKHPLKRLFNLRLGGKRNRRRAIGVKIKKDSREIIFVGTHLSLISEERQAMIGKINKHLLRYKKYPIILTGDINAIPNSKTLKLIEENWENPLKGSDLLSFPARRPKKLIDYIFFRKGHDFEIKSTQIPQKPYSDHLPVIMDILLYSHMPNKY